MRVVREIGHPDFKITIYAWNNRYLIKVEQGAMEQTFKLPETDFINDAEVVALVDEEFLQDIQARFENMHESLNRSRDRHLN